MSPSTPLAFCVPPFTGGPQGGLRTAYLLLLTLLLTASTAAPAPRSPLALVAHGSRLYVAEATAARVAIVEDGRLTSEVDLPADPTGLALSPDGATLWVTCGVAEGRLVQVDARAGRVLGDLPVGHGPTAPVVARDGSVWLARRYRNEVIRVAEGRIAATISAVREPVALALTPDGTRLVIANLLPAGPADGDFIAAAVSLADPATNRVGATVPLPNGSTGVRGLTLSPDGDWAYVTHILGRYGLPTTQLERGWMNTNALSVIDVGRGERLATVLLDEVDRGAANPWGVVCSSDGRWLAVAHAGTHEVSLIDRVGLHDKLARLAAGEAVGASATLDDVAYDLSFLLDLRRRVALPGLGPRGLAAAGDGFVAAQYFSDDLATVDPASGGAGTVSLGERVPETMERRGERLFADASLCFQQWQSCTSCHPDARADGLNWDLLNDGIGNPKQTKSLLLAHQTPPAMVTGVRASANVAVRSGIRHIQFAIRPEEDADAIDTYLSSLRPLPSPWADDPAVARGKALFEQADCARCHPAPLGTDLKPYDLGHGRRQDAGTAFDTPTLVEVWRTAPYLYDGRAATLEAMLREHNVADRHGKTASLSDAEIGELAAYVRGR